VAATASQPEDNKTLPEKRYGNSRLTNYLRETFGSCSVDERIALVAARLADLGIAADTRKHAAAADVNGLLSALGDVPGTKYVGLIIIHHSGGTSASFSSCSDARTCF
jgi:hypothetical protein